MSKLARISVDEARSLLSDDNSNHLLVCAYKDEEKCKKHRLNGSLNMKELRRREASLQSDHPIIFYCN